MNTLNNAPATAEPAASATQAGAANPAAPVVLPEPLVIATTKSESPTQSTVEFDWKPAAFKDDGIHKLYTEQQVHTLLTSLAPPAPAAVAVTEAEKLLRAEAARPVSLYWGGRWYGFGAEKASHAKHLRVADALAATPAAKAEVQHQVISGALFDFAGYLTTLPKEDSFPVGGVHEASPMVSALQNWAKKRSLSLDDANVAGWAEVQAEPVALQMCSELKPRSESEKAAYLAGVADGRMYAERDADTAPQAQPADAQDAETIKKAARYEWLRAQGMLLDGSGHPNFWRCMALLGGTFSCGENADDTIDAAMAAAQEGGKASAGKDGAA